MGSDLSTSLPAIKRLTPDLLRSVTQQARESPRRRQNYNFHQLASRVQRFLNALQPSTYVRPHRHLRPKGVEGFEFFLVLQGSLGIVIFDAQAQVVHTERISASGNTCGIELPEATYHTLVVLEPDTVILELKEGPYDPKTDKEFLTAFPKENTPAALEQVRIWEQIFATEKPPVSGA